MFLIGYDTSLATGTIQSQRNYFLKKIFFLKKNPMRFWFECDPKQLCCRSRDLLGSALVQGRHFSAKAIRRRSMSLPVICLSCCGICPIATVCTIVAEVVVTLFFFCFVLIIYFSSFAAILIDDGVVYHGKYCFRCSLLLIFF